MLPAYCSFNGYLTLEFIKAEIIVLDILLHSVKAHKHIYRVRPAFVDPESPVAPATHNRSPHP